MDISILEQPSTLVKCITMGANFDTITAMHMAAEQVNTLLTDALTVTMPIARRPDRRTLALPPRHNRRVQNGHMTSSLSRAAKIFKIYSGHPGYSQRTACLNCHSTR